MHGFEYRWLLLNPILRGVFLSLAVATFCAACLYVDQTRSPAGPAATARIVAAVPPDAEVDWPGAALRLWLLVPHLVTLSPR
jgi:hypothetical protein